MMNSKFLHQNMHRLKKRERTQNWTYEEKRFLLDLCRKDMKIIENKRLDSSLTAVKNKAWCIIHQKFTATFGTDRDCNRLKEQWRRMKACTRAEMIDFQHRVSKYGQEIADRKRPSVFTFEIWNFMQEAKRACKNDDEIDYSNIKLSLEENSPDDYNTEINHELLRGDNDREESTMWSYLREKSTENICEVEIKEEQNTCEGYDFQSQNLKHFSNNVEETNNQSWKRRYSLKNNQSIPSLSINNVAATLDTLNLIKNHMSRKNVDDDSRSTPVDANFKQYFEMQTKEHMLRLHILQIEVETAKFNRDTAEINRQIALKKFNEHIVIEEES